MTQEHTVLLPDIGEGVVEGEVIEWLKAVGDTVEQDEPIVTVMTDKATVDLPAPYPGKLIKQFQSPGEIAIKDKPIYTLEVADSIKLKKAKVKKSVESAPARQIALPAAAGKSLATPATRGLAKELGVDINQVGGSGPEGRVTARDLTVAYSSQAAISHSGKRAAPIVAVSTPVLDLPGDEHQPLIGHRNYIAEKMSEAMLIVPHFAYFDTMDCTRLMQLRSSIKPEAAKNGVKLTYMPFFIRALSMCLTKFPMFNASLDLENRRLVYHKAHNLGLAVKTDNGVIVPVLKGVEKMNLGDVILAYEELKNKALADTLEASDMRDATITISNFGAVGGKWATPIVNYPEVAILGLAKIEPQPVVKDRQLEIRDLLNLSWCCDHRVIDGHMVAECCNYFMALLENPSRIL